MTNEDDEFRESRESRDDVAAAGTKGVKYLSVKASIKEDLQAIFELQKEVGQAVWSLHKLIASLHAGAGATQTAFVQAHTDLAELIDKLSERQDSLQEKLEDLTELTEGHLNTVHTTMTSFHKEFEEHRKTLYSNWDRINVAIDTVLKANGVDPKTLAQPNQEILTELRDAKVRRERWINAIIGAAVGLLSTGILGLYANAVRADQAETHESTKVILKKVEDIADSVKKSQKTLDEHIDNEDKAVQERAARRNRQ